MNSSERLFLPADTGILFTAWSDRETPALQADTPALLLPVLGKSLLQRALEQLVRLGCRHIHVVLGDDAAPIRAFLQDGERWGCRLSYHYLSAQTRFAGLIRSLQLAPGQNVWLADAAQCPEIAPTTAPSRHVWHAADGVQWSGWSCLPADWLHAQDLDLSYAAQARWQIAAPQLLTQRVSRPLAATSLAELLRSAQAALPAPPTIHMGRHCRIHPSARLIPPVWLGDHVKIAADAIVGPNAIIESHAFIDAGTTIRHSLIMPASYVGVALSLHDSITQGPHLAHIPLQSLSRLPDNNLLASLESPRWRSERLLALALHVALAPLQLLALCRKPAPESCLQHFRQYFYPGLPAVVVGRMSLLGPCSPAKDAPAIRPGLLREALLHTAPDPDTTQASDLLAAAEQGQLRASLRLLRRYLTRVGREIFSLNPATTEQSVWHSTTFIR